MNEPFEWTLATLGAAALGLVWGWWCGMRFGIAGSRRFNWFMALIFTGVLALLAWWMTASRHAGWILFICAGGSAFFYFLWLEYLRKRATEINDHTQN